MKVDQHRPSALLFSMPTTIFNGLEKSENPSHTDEHIDRQRYLEWAKSRPEIIENYKLFIFICFNFSFESTCFQYLKPTLQSFFEQVKQMIDDAFYSIEYYQIFV